MSRDFSRSACRETPQDAARDNQHSSDSRSSSVQCDDSEVCVLSKTFERLRWQYPLRVRCGDESQSIVKRAIV